MNNSERSVPIDCLRGIAILWVLAYHLIPLRIFSLGTYGVLLFFVISGYCISFSADTSKSAWHFYAKRLGRLFPALIVCSFITTLLKYLAPQLLEPDRLSKWWDFFYTPIGLATLNLLQRSYNLPDGTYWSLVVEFDFYAICFAAILVGLRNHLLPILCLVAWISTLTINPATLGFSDYLPYFIAGISVALLVRGRFQEALVGIGMAFAIDAYHLWTHVSDPSVPVTVSRIVFLWIATLAVYGASIYKPSRLVEILLAPLGFFGLISYPLYLIHYDVGFMIIKWSDIPTEGFGLVERIGVALLMSLCAWLIYYFIERHAIKPLTRVLTMRWSSSRETISPLLPNKTGL